MNADDQNDDGKLIDLASRIAQAKNEPNAKPINASEEEKPEDYRSNKGSRAASEFLANVISGGLIGYGVDWLFDTQPWGLLFFLVMGFVSAVFRANAAMLDKE